MNRSDLASFPQTVAQDVLQFGDVVNLLNSGLDVVLHAAITNAAAIEKDITGTPITVTRLAHGADVYHRLAAIQRIEVVDLFRAVELKRFGEDTWYVRVALE